MKTTCYFIVGVLLLTAAIAHAQTPSGVTYPVAQCSGGTCPSPAATRSHITATFLDTLTETMYVAGPFRTLGAQTRIGLGSMNGATGALNSFAPVVDTFGCIYAMAIKGDTLFVGGRFNNINGTPRINFAAIRISNGQLLPGFSSGIGGSGDTVFSIVVSQGRIYTGGKFTTVFAAPRTNIARLNYNGAVDATWVPAGFGRTRKIVRQANRVLVLADIGSEQRIARIDTGNAATVFQILATTNSPSPAYSISDFVTRNDSIYAVGGFYEIDNVIVEGFAASNITNGNERNGGITIPLSVYDKRSKVNIEIYRDSLYISTFNAYDPDPAYHRLYVVYYSRTNLRLIKTYNSNQTALNGYYAEDLVIGNARMYEVERFGQHTAFMSGSTDCSVYSWCMKIPVLCGNWVTTSSTACPNDTFWVSIQHQYYYSSYNWSTISSNITLYPNFDSCMVVTGPGYTGCTIRVTGSTSCGVTNSFQRTINVSAVYPPVVSAGPDDSLSCTATSLVLHGTCIPAPASWTWTGPNALSNADTVFVNTPGTFVLHCVGTNGCRKNDTAIVFADTVPPALVPFGNLPQLTCAQTTVTLDASPVYPNDSLRWMIGAASYANPASASIPGNVLLVITDRRNGCSSTDTLFVAQNVTTPSASINYSDTLLSCAVDTIVLAGTSSNTDVTFHWEDANLNVFSDPMFVDTVGAYGLFATDTTNGCSSGPFTMLINGWFTPPDISVATDSFNTNCSSNTVQLTASSLTSSATLAWTDSLAFNAGNPATATAQGMYYVIATDSLNGCTATDSAYVGFQSTLDVIGVNDTIICPGSGAVLNVIPVGGTSPFNYSWNNSGGNTALVTVYPSDTLQYVVTVGDGAGCVGYDTVIVNVPDAIADSTLSFQPCDPNQPTGQVQVYPWGGVPPYQFSSDGGLTWQSSGVFTGLTFGSYQFVISDAIGCTQNTIALIDSNSLSPSPVFLVSTSPDLGDTIVIVDISNPRPDSVVWDFPFGTTIVDSSMFAPEIIPADTGSFAITVHAWYGTCEVVYTRQISIQPFDSLNAEQWTMNGIDSLIVYPNPNNGTFTVHTELSSKQNFVLIVTDELGNEHARQPVSDADEWTGAMSISNPVPGNYLLRVIAEYDEASTVIVISQ